MSLLDRRIVLAVLVGLLLVLNVYFVLVSKQYTSFQGGDGGKASVDRLETNKTVSVVKFAVGARLGNHIFELISLFGISRKLERRPLVVSVGQTRNLVEEVRSILPGLIEQFDLVTAVPSTPTIRQLNKEICCVYEDLSPLKAVADQHLMISGQFFQSYKYFDDCREEILGFMDQPANAYAKAANGSVPPLFDDDIFVVCTHIRRGDFVDDKGGHRGVDVVLMGDDHRWEQITFPTSVRLAEAKKDSVGKVFVSGQSNWEDLFFARLRCDAVLITAPSSTFGWWLGYFSKGDRTYYMDIEKTNDVNYMKKQLKPDDFFPPRWHKLWMDPSGSVIQAS